MIKIIGMKKKLILGMIAVTMLCSHDLFLKLDDYFLQPNTQETIQLFNGSFEESENVIDRNRMIDVSLVANGNRTVVDSTQWVERNLTTYLNFKTADAGTYVAGVSTAARTIEMDAARFNNYLAHDGVVDVLTYREENKELDQDAVEQYSKHVKIIFQVGSKTSDDWKTVLNHPIEFVPLENPYDVLEGHSLKVQLLLDGKPLKNQQVGIGHKNVPANEEKEQGHGHGEQHSHRETDGHIHEALKELRTNKDGVVDFELTSSGIWFLKTIHMVPSTETGLTHESNWATLTFQVGSGPGQAKAGDAQQLKSGHGHDHAEESDHGHDHAEESDPDHEHDHVDEGIPSYVFWIGSIFIVGILFFIFNRRK
jgi:uncharacterized GH25 family protein